MPGLTCCGRLPGDPAFLHTLPGISAPEICIVSNIAHCQMLCIVKYFTVGTAWFFYSSRLSVDYFTCTLIVRGVAFLPLTTRSLRAHGFVVRYEIWGWGALG